MSAVAGQGALFASATAFAQATEGELLDAVSDAAMVLLMGETGIAAHTRDGLHSELLDAARELERRWAG